MLSPESLQVPLQLLQDSILRVDPVDASAMGGEILSEFLDSMLNWDDLRGNVARMDATKITMALHCVVEDFENLKIGRK